MDEDLSGELGADEYDDLVDALAGQAAAAMPDRSASDAAWDAANQIVPSLTPPVCDQILTHAASDPDAVLVAQVTQERESDDAEVQRAKALTALVGDVQMRAAPEDAEE